MLRVISLWCVWTLTTLGHSVLAQRLLRVHGLSSVDVAAAEFLFGSMAVLVHAAGSKQRLQPVMVAVFSQPGRAWLLAALHAAGSWATLHAMTSLTVPLVQSFKASETLLTSVACMFLLGATYRPNYFQAVMLLGISVGLAVATGASLAGGRWSTVAVALGGSLCVVLRNVLSKRLPELYGVALNAWLTVGGLICMMPPCAVRLATGQGLLATTTVSTGAQLQVLVLGLAATGILHWAYNAGEYSYVTGCVCDSPGVFADADVSMRLMCSLVRRTGPCRPPDHPQRDEGWSASGCRRGRGSVYSPRQQVGPSPCERNSQLFVYCLCVDPEHPELGRRVLMFAVPPSSQPSLWRSCVQQATRLATDRRTTRLGTARSDWRRRQARQARLGVIPVQHTTGPVCWPRSSPRWRWWRR